MIKEFEVGDRVWFHRRSGAIQVATVENIIVNSSFGTMAFGLSGYDVHVDGEPTHVTRRAQCYDLKPLSLLEQIAEAAR